MIALIGPGAAGKSTVGALLAERLAVPFIDLDRQFESQVGNISHDINHFGYEAYARANVEAYLSFCHEPSWVAALSSGFMTYPKDIHPRYEDLRRCIEDSRTTFVLLPSFDYERCLVETLRRQLERSFAKSREQEEMVIRERFPIYASLRARKIETMRPLTLIVDEIADAAGMRMC